LRDDLQQQSIRDSLTGLFNRRSMEESPAREILRAERSGETVGVIMEEFILILPETHLEVAHQWAAQLHEGFRRLTIPHRDQEVSPVTLSLGVAVYPMHGATHEAVLKAADMALYRAKQAGRDCVVVAQ
jgi:GGDEF domain-containing protein